MEGDDSTRPNASSQGRNEAGPSEQAHRDPEAQLRILIDNVREYAIFMTRTDRTVTTWNTGAERILGFSEEEMIGRSADVIFTEEDRAAGAPEREAATALRDGQAADERVHRRKDGSRFWGTGIMTAVYAPGGEHIGFAKVFRDNTERKEAEDRLKAMNADLERRVEERTRQVRDLASSLTLSEKEERRRISQILHDDLQQMLYGLQMKVGFMLKDARRGDFDRLPGLIEQSYKWISEAITTTRQLTVDLSPPVLAGEGLTDALHWLASQMQDVHGLQVKLVAEHEFRIPDENMRVLVFLMIRELLFNVVKHAGTKHATVELQQPDSHIVVSVSDEGRGFDPAEEPERKGGFGLFSVRERLALFGGEVGIESAPGKGTCVTLSVPVNLAPRANRP